MLCFILITVAAASSAQSLTLQVVFPSSCEVPPEAAYLAESLFLASFQRGDGGILDGRGSFTLFVVAFVCLFFQELSFCCSFVCF